MRSARRTATRLASAEREIDCLLTGDDRAKSRLPTDRGPAFVIVVPLHSGSGVSVHLLTASVSARADEPGHPVAVPELRERSGAELRERGVRDRALGLPDQSSKRCTGAPRSPR